MSFKICHFNKNIKETVHKVYARKNNFLYPLPPLHLYFLQVLNIRLRNEKNAGALKMPREILTKNFTI